ncbi:MAG: DUF61 family protein [Sulfolobales archaeon]
MRRDDLVEVLLREELKIVNKHLPHYRKSLKELLKEEFPSVICRDGTQHFFRRSELERVSTLIDKENWDHVFLPVVITIIPESRGIVGVIEDKYAIELVSRILGIEHRSEKLFIYEPQLFELRRNYSTIFQLALSYTPDLSFDLEKPSNTYTNTKPL